MFTHRFPAPGQYQIGLTVADESGAAHTVSRMISVLASTYLEFDELPGRTGGGPADTMILRTRLSRWLTADTGVPRLGALLIRDLTPPRFEQDGVLIEPSATSAPGIYAGLKLDAAILSTRQCNTSTCAAFLSQESAAQPWQAYFRPGETSGSPTVIPFGTRADGTIDDAQATLDVLDANASRANAHGFLSFGFGGALLLVFPQPIDPANLWLYLGAILDDPDNDAYDAGLLAFPSRVTLTDLLDAPAPRPPGSEGAAQPTASFVARPPVGPAPLVVAFDGSASTDATGSGLSYSWSFSDGTMAVGASNSHLFETRGIHAARLVVTDGGGATAVARGRVGVLPSDARALSLTKLAGTAGGGAHGTSVYRASLSATNLASIASVTILDGSAGTGGAPGAASGLDIDGVKLSTELCTDAVCAAAAQGLALFSFSPADAPFLPGTQRSPARDALMGTTPGGGAVDDDFATLDAFDAVAVVSSSAHGYLSLGDGGALSLNLVRPLETGNAYLYLGIVNDTGGIASSSVWVAGATVPLVRDRSDSIEAASEQIERGELLVDLDGDGYREYQRTLDASGKVTHWQIDHDRDGHPELEWNRSAAGSTSTIDRDGDGVPEETREVSGEPPPSNVLVRLVTMDADDDGRVDRRITERIDPSSPEIQVLEEIDRDGDGTLERSESTTIPRVQEEMSFATGSKACSTDTQEDLREAYDIAVSRGAACLLGIDETLAYQFIQLVAGTPIVFDCDIDQCPSYALACADDHDVANHERDPSLPVKVHFREGLVGYTTVFHELLHYIFGPHLRPPLGDPRDRISQCVFTCFGSPDREPTSGNCAGCIGASPDDPRCDSFTYPGTGYLCSCDGKIYAGEVECAVECPTGLGCFSFTCTPVSPSTPSTP